MASILAFGLLIVFRESSSLWLEETLVQAPVSHTGRPWDSGEARALLGIDRNGQYYFNRRAIQNATLPATLDSAFRLLPCKTTLYIWADRDVAASTVEEVLALARAHGVKYTALVTVPPFRP